VLSSQDAYRRQRLIVALDDRGRRELVQAQLDAVEWSADLVKDEAAGMRSS
jgi:hypothetical protein